jgi:hypothetical protein
MTHQKSPIRVDVFTFLEGEIMATTTTTINTINENIKDDVVITKENISEYKKYESKVDIKKVVLWGDVSCLESQTHNGYMMGIEVESFNNIYRYKTEYSRTQYNHDLKSWINLGLADSYKIYSSEDPCKFRDIEFMYYRDLPFSERWNDDGSLGDMHF